MTPNSPESALLHTALKHYRHHWQTGAYSKALNLADTLLSAHPDNIELFWYRCCCLEALGKHAQCLHEIEHHPLMQQNPRLRAATESGPELNDLPLFSLTLAKMPADLCQKAAPWFTHPEKKLALYKHLITLEPEQAQWWAQRGALLLEKARLNPTGLAGKGPPEALLHMLLEKALKHYQQAKALQPSTHLAPEQAGILISLLQQYLEASSPDLYDQALALLPENTPEYSQIMALRTESEQRQTQFESELVNHLTQSLKENLAGKHTVQNDLAYSMGKHLEEALRTNPSFTAAMETIETLSTLSDEDLAAMNIARKIFFMAHRDPDGFQPVQLEDYPKHQAQYIRKITRQLETLGCTHLGNFADKNQEEQTGSQLALGVYQTPNRQSYLVTGLIKPLWPGLLPFILLKLSRKWLPASQAIELNTRFSTGHILSTLQSNAPLPFDAGPMIEREILPEKTSFSKFFDHHQRRVQAFLAAHKAAKCIAINTIQDIQEAYRSYLNTYQSYRQSIHYVTDEEMKNILGDKHALMADRIRQQLRILAQRHLPEDDSPPSP